MFKSYYFGLKAKSAGCMCEWREREKDKMNNLGTNVINKLKSSVATLCCNKALWLDVPSHVTSFNQSAWFFNVA